MEKVLYAVDELTGLIGAVALMRPSKSVMDLELKSVKKKFKQPSFAAGCSREVIQQGAALLALQAGADILLMPYDYIAAYQGVLAAVEDGTIPEERIDESVLRILRLKAAYGAEN